MAFLKETKSTSEHPRLTVSLTGHGGSGKTTLGAHLPWDSNPSWEGKGIYIAADPTSPQMASILSQDRERWYVYVPNGNEKRDPDGKKLTDWKKETAELCFTDWGKVHPDAKVLFWDSFSTTAYKLLDENAKMNYFSQEGPQSGVKDKTDKRFYTEKEEREALGNLGDYRMVQNACYNMLHWLVNQETHSGLHIIVGFHPCVQKPDPIRGTGLRFGPDITGEKGPTRIPQIFDSNLWVDREFQDPKRAGAVKLTLVPTDRQMVNVKSVRPSEIPKEIIFGPETQEIRDFWLTLQNWKRG